MQPFTEKYGHLANLDIAPNFTGVQVVLPGQSGFPDALIDSDKNNFAPRLGFAYRPMKNKRLQVRGGYSIFYDGTAYNTIAVRLAGQPPFASTGSLQTSPTRVLTIQDGFGNDETKEVTNTFAVSRAYLLPYAQTWSVAVQDEFKGIVVEANYLGTKGTRLDVLRLPNRAAPGSPLTAEDRRQIGNAVGFTFDSSEGNSIYHAIQLRLIRRLRRGLSTNVFYTFSKSIDNASSIGGSGNVVAQDDRDLSAERGLSIFDRRHQLTWMSMVNSPFGERGFFLKDRSFAARMLQDWNLSTSVTARSGAPLTARVLGNVSDSAGTGAVGSGRADATGVDVSNGSGFFDLSAFTLPPSGRFGNAGRNTISGPGLFSLDVSLGRAFTLSDRKRLEFRVSSVNVLNNVNYSSLATVVNAVELRIADRDGTDAADQRPSEVSILMRWLGLFLTASLFAQQDYTFKSATNLVVVNVIVHDKKGAIIEDLKPNQFTVLENGKPQTISVFEFQRLSAELAPPATQTLTPARTPVVAAPSVEPATGPLRYKDRRLLVLFFDFAGMPVPDQMRAQETAKKFVTEQMTKSDSVAIMSFGSAVKLEQEFTDDKDQLLTVVKKFRLGEGLTGVDYGRRSGRRGCTDCR